MITFKILGYLKKDNEIVGYRVELSEEADGEAGNWLVNVKCETANRLGMNICEVSETKNGVMDVRLVDGCDITSEEVVNGVRVKYIEDIVNDKRMCQCLMYDEEFGEYSTGVTFNCVDDCSVCTFGDGTENSDLCADIISLDHEGKCSFLSEEDKSMPIGNLVSNELKYAINAEVKEYEAYEREMKEEEKKKQRAKDRNKTRLANWSINKEISHQRKLIKGLNNRKCYIESMISLAGVLSNISGSGIERNIDGENSTLIEIDKEIKEANETLNELIRRRNKANAERRKERQKK